MGGALAAARLSRLHSCAAQEPRILLPPSHALQTLPCTRASSSSTAPAHCNRRLLPPPPPSSDPESASLRLYCHDLDQGRLWEVLEGLRLLDKVHIAARVDAADAVLSVRWAAGELGGWGAGALQCGRQPPRAGGRQLPAWPRRAAAAQPAAPQPPSISSPPRPQVQAQVKRGAKAGGQGPRHPHLRHQEQHHQQPGARLQDAHGRGPLGGGQRLRTSGWVPRR
jgi:hypothetical protein